MVNPQDAVQLLYHSHHDADNGLNGGSNEVWALPGGSSMAHAVSIRPSHLQHKQREHRIGWMSMLAWNPTDNILDEVNRRVTTPHAQDRASWAISSTEPWSQSFNSSLDR